MVLPKFTNHARSILASNYPIGASSIEVADASVYPSEFPYDLTLWDQSAYSSPSDDPNMEIVRVTGASSNTLTLSTPLVNPHNAWDSVDLLLTSAFFDDLEQELASKDSALTSHESQADAHHSNTNDPTSDQKAALDGANTPSASNVFATLDDISDLGSGDMLKATYDTDGDGKVNSAEVADSAPWSGITGKPSTYPPETHTHTESEISDLGSYIPTSEKGAASGVATLDINSKVPTSQLPDSVTGALEYQGLWDASTNTPTLDPLTPSEKGHYYKVSVAGTFDSKNFAVGDWLISNGTAWDKLDGSDAVSSVDGKVGAVDLSGDYEPLFSKNTAFNKNFGSSADTVCEGNDGRLSDARTPLAHEHTESEISDLGDYEPAFTKNTAFNKNFGTGAGTVCEGDDSRLSDARTPTDHGHVAADISDFDTEVGNHTDVAANTSHRGSTSNPHGVTVEQIGALASTGGVLSGILTFDAEYDNGTSGSIDWNNGQKQKVTLTSDLAITFTDFTVGIGNITLKVVQDATGGWTPTWPGSVTWLDGDPVIDTEANAVTIVTFYFDGTTYWGAGPTSNSINWTDVDKTSSDLADLAIRSHTSLTDIGTNTHAQIDSHIGDTDNPHSVTKDQVGLGNVDDVQQIPMSQKNVAGGVASLDANGDVPLDQIPDTLTGKSADMLDGSHLSDIQTDIDAKIPLTEKAATNGVATLDATGNVPATQLGNVTSMEMHGDEWHSVNYLKDTDKDVAGGVVGLDGSGNVSVGGDISATGSITTDRVYTSNNDLGTNIKIGDDAWVGDVNIANFIGIKGVADATLGGIVLGSAKDTNLYRGGDNILKTDDLFQCVGLDVGSQNITNVADPVDAQDGATKNYVDTQVANVKGLIPKTVRFDGQLTTNMPQQFSTLEVDATLTAVRAVLRGSLPTGSSIKVQVTKNGSAPADSVLASDLPIEITTSETAEANGVYVVEGTLDSGMTTCSKYDWFQATITQVGTEYAGNDLDVQLVFE